MSQNANRRSIVALDEYDNQLEALDTMLDGGTSPAEVAVGVLISTLAAASAIVRAAIQDELDNS